MRTEQQRKRELKRLKDNAVNGVGNEEDNIKQDVGVTNAEFEAV